MSKKTEKSDRKKALIDIIETDEANGLYEMTEKEKLRVVSRCFENVIWMAIRYADGRFTYAPSVVRDAVKAYKSVHPEWNPSPDITIKPPAEKDVSSLLIPGDYLYDLVNPKNNQQ
jgi:hypothetical protein